MTAIGLGILLPIWLAAIITASRCNAGWHYPLENDNGPE